MQCDVNVTSSIQQKNKAAEMGKKKAEERQGREQTYVNWVE